MLVNNWLKIVSKFQIEDFQFIESFFYLLSETQKINPVNVKNFQMVDVQTLDLIREIKYKIFDSDENESRQQIGRIFFKSLI